MSKMKYALNEEVKIAETQKSGTVMARCEYAEGDPNNYLVRHVDADGDLVRRWFNEGDLSSKE